MQDLVSLGPIPLVDAGHGVIRILLQVLGNDERGAFMGPWDRRAKGYSIFPVLAQFLTARRINFKL
jgi:hypothetical protein